MALSAGYGLSWLVAAGLALFTRLDRDQALTPLTFCTFSRVVTRQAGITNPLSAIVQAQPVAPVDRLR
jgi:hypothetical protein